MKTLRMLFFAFLLALPLYSPASELDINELEKMTLDLLGSLSPAEQEAVLKQAAEMDQYINSLPEDERKKLEENLEKELKGLMDSGVLQDLTKSVKEAPAPKPAPVFEEPKEEVKEEKVVPKISAAVPELQAAMKELSSRITDLMLKSEASSRVSSNHQLENIWATTKPDLAELQSYVLVISNNNNVANALLSDEFKMLDNQLRTFNTNLKNELNKVKSEKISKDSIAERFNLDAIIKFVEQELGGNQLLWNTKRLIQKHAPEAIKATTPQAVKKNDFSGPASGATIASYKGPRYAPAKIAPQPPAPYRPTPFGSVGSTPGIAQRPTQDKFGAQQGGEQPQRAQAGPSQAPAGSAVKKGEKSQTDKPQAEKPRSGGSTRPATNPLDAAAKQLKEKMQTEAKPLSKKIKESDISSKIKAYKSSIEKKETQDIAVLSADISSTLTQLDAMTVLPSRIAEQIRSNILTKISEKEKYKKEKADFLKTIDPKGRSKKLKEDVTQLLTKDFAEKVDALNNAQIKSKFMELKTKAESLKKNIDYIENTIRGKV